MNFFTMMVRGGQLDNQSKNYGPLPYFLALLGSIIWPLAWIYSNEHNINTAQTTMIRGITVLLINYLVCSCTKSPITFFESQSFSLLIFRAGILALSSLLIGASQYILPLQIVHTIICSTTLFVYVADYLINLVEVNLKQGVGITIGMIGMLLASHQRLINIWIDPKFTYQSEYQNYVDDNITIIGIFTICFIGVMVLWSYTIVLTKQLRFNPFQINFMQGIAYLFSGAILYQFLIPHKEQYSQAEYSSDPYLFYKAIIFTGIPLLIHDFILVSALNMAKDTGVIMMIYFTSIIVGYALSIFRYEEKTNMVMNLGVILLGLGMYQTLINTNQVELNAENMSTGSDQEDENQKEKGKDNKISKKSRGPRISQNIIIHPLARGKTSEISINSGQKSNDNLKEQYKQRKLKIVMESQVKIQLPQSEKQMYYLAVPPVD